MNTNDLREHFLTNSPWVNRHHTVDTVKAGDPTREIHTVAVGWMSDIDSLRRAAELGCDLFVTHEPTFWQHQAPEDKLRDVEPGLTKARLLEETGLVVLRCHDAWDSWPGVGIRDSWAAWLELGDPVALGEGDYPWHATYAVEPQPLREFAARVARRIAPLGEDSVSVMGDPQRIVSRPAVGVGCGGPDQDMIDAGADTLIVCYDGASYWATRERLWERGAAVIAVEHGTSEIPGLMNLAKYVDQTFPDLTVHYIDRHPRTWTVTSE
jgi:putative NIF3 family GTP cyclohydrolase 1 type 2